MNKLRQKGFTLIELMVIVAIVAILAVFGIPTFNTFMERKAVEAVVTELTTTISLARSEAVSKGRITYICPLQAGSTSQCAANGTNWENGWLIYMEGDGDKLDLQVFQPTRVTIRGTFQIAPAMIMPNGLLYPGTQGELIFTILPKSGNKASGKQVTFEGNSLTRRIADVS